MLQLKKVSKETQRTAEAFLEVAQKSFERNITYCTGISGGSFRRGQTWCLVTGPHPDDSGDNIK